jgi:putative methyltransferase (TIGR04325 family)
MKLKKIILSIFKILNLYHTIRNILYKYKILERYRISNKISFSNTYQDNLNLEKIKTFLKKKVSKSDSSLLLKFYKLTKKKKLKVADWGGGYGNNMLYLSKKNKLINCTVFEKFKLVHIINKSKNLNNYFRYNKIKFKSSNKIKNFKKYDLLLFFGSISYIKNIYKILNKSLMPAYIGISRLPLITNSENEPVLLDTFNGYHYEKFNSKKKLLRYLKKNYQILLFKEDPNGLPESKRRILSYNLKSYNIFLKKLN